MFKLLQKEFESLDLIGLGIAYSHKNKIYSFSFGKANLDFNINISENTIFNIASIGKLFTVIAIFQLIEKGNISLEDNLPKFLNELPSSWSKVKIKHLLTHTSGIKNYTDIETYWKETRLDVSKERIIEYIIDYPLQFLPGSEWSYNNTGFFLLGLIIEKVSEQNYFDYVHKEIIKPLNLKSVFKTDYYSTIPYRATGYIKNEDKIKISGYYSNSVTYSAGGFSMSLSDFLLFETALFEKKIINQETLNLIKKIFYLNNGKNLKENYPHLPFNMCYGIFLFNYQNKNVYAHAGEIRGFSSAYLRVLEDDFSVIASTNTEDRNKIQNLLYKIYDIWRIKNPDNTI